MKERNHEQKGVGEILGTHVPTLAERRWRGLVWLTGDTGTCRTRALALWQGRQWQAPLWLAPVAPEGVAAGHWLPPAKGRNRLGGELDLLVVDAVSPGAGFDPDAFGALAGTLRAGGLLVLMTPPHWGARPDGDYARMADHPWRVEQLSARYLARLARRLETEPAVARWPAGREPQLPSITLPSHGTPESPADPDCLTRDQAEAVARLTRLRRRRPLVLTADRGRGKTAALGIACARLLARGEEEVRLVAPRPAAVSALFERLERLRPSGQRKGHVFLDPDGGRVVFTAPDELVAQVEQGLAGGAGSLLLVDEAAAIPAALLDRWLAAFPRIAFATTVHGYEGSGRGFALRFRERLERRTPDWQAFHLDQPIRWAANDPLEGLVARLLLLDAEPGAAAPPDSPLEWRHWSRTALAQDETTLRTLFGLLVQAHYRTTPADLRRLLDGPGVRLAGLESGGCPQAVAVTGDEGGFSADLAERVARGERRPRGHLLAQSLAAHAGSRKALEARLRRIVRIAVHPDRRREGLGRRLLEVEREQARAEGVALLGASFGAEPGLIAFWRTLGFRAVRLGLTRETATGEHALMVVAPTSPAGESLTETLQAHFQRHLPTQLAFELSELDPAVVVTLLAEGTPVALGGDDRRDLADVAHGHRDPVLARPAIQALVRHAAVLDEREGSHDLALLAAWAFQGRDTAWLAAKLEMAGRRQVTAWLRASVARSLHHS